MGDTQMLSLSNVKRITGVLGKKNKNVRWHDVNITVKPMLTMNEYIDTVRRILEDCVSKDGGVMFELIDFAIKWNIILAYSYVQLPEDISDLYYIVYWSDLYDKIVSSVSRKQVDSIIKSVSLYVGGALEGDFF